jgi:GR25 family glycosyltransferase involved in LPS biosynthesis
MVSQLNAGKFSSQKISSVNKDSKQILKYLDDRRIRPLKPAEIACTLTHVKAWKEILKQNLKYSIVLEDDVILSKNFWKITEEIEKVDFPFDLIRLEMSERVPVCLSSPYLKLQHHKICKFYTSQSGFAGYIISSEFIKKLLENSMLFSNTIDSLFLSSNSPLFNSYNFFQVSPALIVQADKFEKLKIEKKKIFNEDFNKISSSNIQVSRHKHIFKQKMLNEIIRPFNQIIKPFKITLKILLLIIIYRGISRNLLIEILSPFYKLKNYLRKAGTSNTLNELIKFS